MRLLYSPTSPYARKARVTAMEKGLADRVTIQTVNVLGDVGSVSPFNPLGKIPALILDDGEVLYDSPVICEYLDSLTADPVLLPSSGDARWRVLRVQALADGIMDAAFGTVMERRRPPQERSAEWLERWRAAILRAAAALEAEAPVWDERLDLGRIAAACALGYVDFRLAEVDWRADNPALAAWFAQVSQRPSLVETIPPVG